MRRISKLLTALSNGAKNVAKSRRPIAIFGITLCFIAVFCAAVLNTRLIAVSDGGKISVVRSMSNDYASVLASLNINLSENDEIKVSEDGHITRLDVLRAFIVDLEADGNTYSEYFTGGTVSDLLMKCNVAISDEDILSVDKSQQLYDGLSVKLSRVIIKEEQKQELIPFDTVRSPSQNVKSGRTVVKVKGENGLSMSLLKNTYVDGELIDSKVIETQMLKKPVTAEIVYGTGGDISTSRGSLRYSHYIDMTATAYTYGNSGKWGNVTATGKAVKVGYVAVDPKVIPLGTRLYISYPNGSFCYGYAVAQDTGGSIKGNKIDLFFETKSECINFGRRTVRVYVLD